jgi:RNA polymerase sigma-70 factor, ECF subfamily
MVEVDQEKVWIERSREGDQAAFGNLVRCHQRMVHSLTYRMTGSMADAEDLAQETFIRAFQQLGGFRGESKFSSWLCRVAINLCLNWRAKESRRGEVHRRWAGQALSADPPGDSATDEVSARVQAALERLPAKQRAAVILTVYEDMNHAQAASVLGCSEATVAWRIFAARRKLKRWLEPVSRGSPGR